MVIWWPSAVQCEKVKRKSIHLRALIKLSCGCGFFIRCDKRIDLCYKKNYIRRSAYKCRRLDCIKKDKTVVLQELLGRC